MEYRRSRGEMDAEIFGLYLAVSEARKRSRKRKKRKECECSHTASGNNTNLWYVQGVQKDSTKIKR